MTDTKNSLLEAIEGIGKSFEEMKKVNDQMLEEERKGNEARAKELSTTLDKISEDLSTHHKNKEVLEKRLAAQQDRLEILEAMNDRPRASVQDKIRDEHKAIFMRMIRNGVSDSKAASDYAALQEKAREYKDVLIGTDASGGFAVPEDISRQVQDMYLKLSPITQHVKNIQVGTSDYKELVSVNAATYAWSSETGSRSATVEPLLRSRAPTWGELYAYPQASNWSLQDLFFDVENWLVSTVAEGMAVGLSTSIYSGNGSANLTGMTNTTPATNDDYASPERNEAAFEYIPMTAVSSPFTTNGIAGDDIIDLVYTLNARYRPNARFAMNTVTQGHVRKLKDTNGQYLWQPSLQVGQPDRLLGYEVFSWEDLGNPTTANAFPVVFGDFSKGYTLVRRNGMAIIRDDVTTPGYRKYYISQRFGGCVTNNAALKMLKVALT